MQTKSEATILLHSRGGETVVCGSKLICSQVEVCSRAENEVLSSGLVQLLNMAMILCHYSKGENTFSILKTSSGGYWAGKPSSHYFRNL